MTKFLSQHPGGDYALMTVAGRDATDPFHQLGHSDAAKEMMHAFYIGELEGAVVQTKEKAKPMLKPLKGSVCYKFLHMATPALLLMGAIVVKVVGDRVPSIGALIKA